MKYDISWYQNMFDLSNTILASKFTKILTSQQTAQPERQHWMNCLDLDQWFQTWGASGQFANEIKWRIFNDA